jgi:hypothetical protein
VTTVRDALGSRRSWRGEINEDTGESLMGLVGVPLFKILQSGGLRLVFEPNPDVVEFKTEEMRAVATGGLSLITQPTGLQGETETT